MKLLIFIAFASITVSKFCPFKIPFLNHLLEFLQLANGFKSNYPNELKAKCILFEHDLQRKKNDFNKNPKQIAWIEDLTIFWISNKEILLKFHESAINLCSNFHMFPQQNKIGSNLQIPTQETYEELFDLTDIYTDKCLEICESMQIILFDKEQKALNQMVIKFTNGLNNQSLSQLEALLADSSKKINKLKTEFIELLTKFDKSPNRSSLINHFSEIEKKTLAVTENPNQTKNESDEANDRIEEFMDKLKTENTLLLFTFDLLVAKANEIIKIQGNFIDELKTMLIT